MFDNYKERMKNNNKIKEVDEELKDLYGKINRLKEYREFLVNKGDHLIKKEQEKNRRTVV